ncbi:sensor domain-containing diguanylate cyclase [Fluoribacter gormanii]|uniref:diguanylate cyclase n=1 Tax=Fluoribacter gormanii TaxID=464 RepID=A0A377GNP3_9GAMM|nr:GGDEF domain-containing protein [Fluoribacter gormanii]KTD00513.1 regulatory protein (GGDEF domain) [Fluoribacter gormanii]SIR08028.1 diguanylate cyclase with GAF sensor [Fluoribacter gormanii]STO26409.1 Diguanylate cyclase DosC [Fluoribacter gormanii]
MDEKTNLSPSFDTYSDSRLSKYVLYVISVPAFVIVLIISIYSYKQVRDLVEVNNWVAHSYQVTQATDKILYTVVDIESHQRGYLVTNDNLFLEYIKTATKGLTERFDNLLQLTKDNPPQHERVIHFIDLVNQRLKIIHQVIQFKKDNNINSQDTQALVHKGQEISDVVRSLGNEINAVEMVLLNERNLVVINSAHKTNLIIIIGSIVSLSGLIAAFLLGNYELASSLKAERRRISTEIQLKSILESASDMIAAVNSERRFIIFNESYHREIRRIFSKSITIGITLEEAFADVTDSNRALITLWEESLKGEEFVKNIELEINKERNIYEITSSLIINQNNEVKGAVHIVRNITKWIEEQNKLKDLNSNLNSGLQALKDKNRQITLLVEMSDILLACGSLEELNNVVTKYCQRALNFANGYLYVLHPSKNYFESVASWGDPTPQEASFTPEHCWAIRLGHIHTVSPSHHDLICNHIKIDDDQKLLSHCVPLMAQNDIYGLLFLEMKEEDTTLYSDDHLLLIKAFSELIALAYANVRLRENLRYQSIRDPLTGLYNRRYLEDFLFKQIHQAERAKLPLSILMLDLDHFKRINDTYGHDAGDVVLIEVGKVLQEDIRVEDMASRYGGEEFVIVFFNADPKSIKPRADNIRHAISMLKIKYGVQHVGPITISIGISSYPEHGRTLVELIEAADKALYFAKNNGRNQVVLYSDIQNNTESSSIKDDNAE